MDVENNSIDRIIDAIKGGEKKENGNLLTFLESQQVNNLARVRNDLLIKENEVSSERDNLIEERRKIFDEATFTNDSIVRHEAAKKLLSFDRKAHDYSQLMDSINSQIALVDTLIQIKKMVKNPEFAAKVQKANIEDLIQYLLSEDIQIIDWRAFINCINTPIEE